MVKVTREKSSNFLSRQPVLTILLALAVVVLIINQQSASNNNTFMSNDLSVSKRMPRPPLRGLDPYMPFPGINTTFINLNCQNEPKQFKYNSKMSDMDKRRVLSHPLVKGEHICLVETGTNKGETTEYVARSYDDVSTIEKFEPLYKEALEKFKEYPRISPLGGDTVDILPLVVAKYPHLGNCVYWLDAHNTYAVAGWAVSKNPLLQEFEIISGAVKGKDAYIVMDDYRLFNVQDAKMTSPYPQYVDLQKTVCDKWPQAQFLIGGDTIHIFQ